jgi:hypothetical protein
VCDLYVRCQIFVNGNLRQALGQKRIAPQNRSLFAVAFGYGIEPTNIALSQKE